MWKPEHRRTADRSGLCHPSDLTDTEWTIMEPTIPPAKHRGRRRSVNLRGVLNRIFFVPWPGANRGVAQRPAAEEHGSWLLELWNWEGTLERIHHEPKLLQL
jgi:putative transposase